jgi:pyruvate dehydrogenase phosphatase
VSRMIRSPSWRLCAYPLAVILSSILIASSSTTRIMTRRGVVEHTHDYLGDAKAEKLLREHETTQTFQPIKSTGVVRFDNNWVECNDPIEDRHAESFLSRDVLYTKVPRSEVDDESTIVDLVDRGGLKLFSIMDGHAGYATAELLRKTLHPMIVLSFRSLYAGYKPSTVDPLSAMRQSQKGLGVEKVTSFLWSFLPGHSKSSHSPSSPFPIDSQSISDALTSAFLELDFQICNAPLRMIPHIPAKPGKPNLRPIVKPMIEPADNGACAVTCLVDEDREEIYVANAGDARAVAGYWVDGHRDASGKEVQGGWRCEVLTEDQMGDNPREIERYVFWLFIGLSLTPVDVG